MDAHKDKAIAKKYSAALMSNHKWRKFFAVMAEHGSEIRGIEYHFTDTKNVFFGSAPTMTQVWATAIDDPVSGAGGPVEYKHIEYLLIPYTYEYRQYEKGPLIRETQNLESFIQALKNIGEFPLSETEKGIVVRGYK